MTYREVEMTYEEINGVWSQHLIYCNFLKYDKSVIKDCLLPYSNHLKKHWEPELVRPLTKS